MVPCELCTARSPPPEIGCARQAGNAPPQGLAACALFPNDPTLLLLERLHLVTGGMALVAQHR